MKIKLHNSMGKISKEHRAKSFSFFFNNKIFLYFPSKTSVCLYYRIDDNYFFLNLSYKTKEFTELEGFGRNDKNSNPNWWKDPDFGWKWKNL